MMSIKTLILTGAAGIGIIALGTWLVIQSMGGLTAIYLQPGEAFDVRAAPPPPDYQQSEAWAAFPNQKSMANARPGAPAADPARKSPVDVFFVHPTTYLSDESWNDRFDRKNDNILQYGVLRVQAGVFNQCCQIYAPRYRQATLWAFIGDEPSTTSSLAFAYHDVRRAFRHFLALSSQKSKNRPFILAAHSQGSLHAMRLLQEEIAGKRNIARRMIAAYLIGYAIPTQMNTGRISACKTGRDINCYVNWNAVTSAYDDDFWTKTGKIWADGKMTDMSGRKLTCVNPLNWRLNGSAEKAAKNKGSLVVKNMEVEKLPDLAPHITSARCDDRGLLIISKPKGGAFESDMVDNGDYHVYDYHLFYANLRDNIAERIRVFFKKAYRP